MLKDKLQIFLITYNRKKFLKRTLDDILDENSPVRNFDIVVLDNASDDGSSELIDEYCKNYSNLKHIRHKINIGGDANICRAFEMGANCGKEYFWVLCDDDKYDFSNWDEVEKEIEKGTDIICVADYVFKNQKSKSNPAFQIFQLTFVPAGIYKSNLIDNVVLINMYNAIYTMLQQSCVAIKVINENKSIKCLSSYIVNNGMFYDDKCEDIAYTRGTDEKKILKRKNDNSWILGYANVLTLLKNRKLINQCMDVATSTVIYENFETFLQRTYQQYFVTFQFNYLQEILYSLSFIKKFYFALYAFLFLPTLILYFYKTDKGYYIKLLNVLKIRIYKFKVK